MKTENNSKRVEKLYSYRLAEVSLFVEQQHSERGVSMMLKATYRVAYTDNKTLSKFVLSVKSDPTKYFKSHFCFGTPINTTVMVDHIDDDFYSIGRKSYHKQIVVVDSFVCFRCKDELKHNRSIIQYNQL